MMSAVITVEDAGALDAVMSIMTRAFDPKFGEAWTAAQCMGVLSMPGAALLVARTTNYRGEPIGFALLRTIAGQCELMLLAVAHEGRGAGIGEALLLKSFEVAVSSGASEYFLEVRRCNSAISLYERLGLVSVGVRSNYYIGRDGVRRDAMTYRRSLA